MRHSTWLAMAATILSFTAMGSSEVCVDHYKGVVELSAHYYFYGGQAKEEIVKPCVDEINRMYNNNSRIQLNKEGPWRDVKVKVTYSILPESYAMDFSATNGDAKVNFVRVDNPTKGSRVVISEHGLNSNYGYFIVSNNLGTSTTCTHEFAHGLGLNHLKDPCDWRGKGVPPIMAPRGCQVDKQYQYDPKAISGKTGGTINPIHRQVHPSEFSAIKMGQLDYEWVSPVKECATQGHTSNNMYAQDGTIYHPINPFTFRQEVQAQKVDHTKVYLSRPITIQD